MCRRTGTTETARRNADEGDPARGAAVVVGAVVHLAGQEGDVAAGATAEDLVDVLTEGARGQVVLYGDDALAGRTASVVGDRESHQVRTDARTVESERRRCGEANGKIHCAAARTAAVEVSGINGHVARSIELDGWVGTNGVKEAAVFHDDGRAA
ncbi:MAG: hypothetical protein R2828_27100 [Saprospiraceae bacterium]